MVKTLAELNAEIDKGYTGAYRNIIGDLVDSLTTQAAAVANTTSIASDVWTAGASRDSFNRMQYVFGIPTISTYRIVFDSLEGTVDNFLDFTGSGGVDTLELELSNDEIWTARGGGAFNAFQLNLAEASEFRFRVVNGNGDFAMEVNSVGGNTRIGFFNTVAAARPTGVAVSAAGVHAALVTLGLITA